MLKILKKIINKKKWCSHGTIYKRSGENQEKVEKGGIKLFNITPQILTNIVNRYKGRDENMQDNNYFTKKYVLIFY